MHEQRSLSIEDRGDPKVTSLQHLKSGESLYHRAPTRGTTNEVTTMMMRYQIHDQASAGAEGKIRTVVNRSLCLVISEA